MTILQVVLDMDSVQQQLTNSSSSYIGEGEPVTEDVDKEEEDWVDIGDEAHGDIISCEMLHFHEKFKPNKLNSFPLEYPGHPAIYQPLQAQFTVYKALTAEKADSSDSVVKTALAQLDLDSNKSSQMYRAIQTLKAQEAGRLAEFQETKRQTIEDLARPFIRAQFGEYNNEQEDLGKLVGFCSVRHGIGTGKPPEFVMSDNKHELTMDKAHEFLAMVDAYLSPAKMYEKMQQKDGTASQILFGHSVTGRSDLVKELKEEKGKYSTQQVKLDYVDCELDLAKMPKFLANETHPHIYIPMFEAALEKCESMQQLSALVINTLHRKENRDTPSFKLLVLLIENRAKILSLKEPLESPVTALAIEHRISRDELIALYQVFSGSVVESVFHALVGGNVFPNQLLKGLSFEFLLLLPKRYLGSLPWKTSKPIVERAIIQGHCNIVISGGFNQLQVSDVYELMFCAVRYNRTSVVQHMFENEIVKNELSVHKRMKLDASKSDQFRTLFAHACLCESIDTLEYLMKTFVIDIEQDFEDNSTVVLSSMGGSTHNYRYDYTLSVLLERGSQKVIDLLLSNYTAQERQALMVPKSSDTVLQRACEKNLLYVVKAIIPLGTKPSNLAELHKWAGQNQDVVKYLQTHETETVQSTSETPVISVADSNYNQQTMFYKQRRVAQAVLKGDHTEFQRWVNAGYKVGNVSSDNLIQWFTYSLEKNHDDVAYEVLPYIKEETLYRLIMIKETLIKLVDVVSEDNCLKVIQAICGLLPESKVEEFLYTFCTTALDHNKPELLIPALKVAADKKFANTRYSNVSKLIIDVMKKKDHSLAIKLLNTLKPEKAKVHLASSAFLQELVAHDSIEQLETFIKALKDASFKFESAEVKDIAVSIKELANFQKRTNLQKHLEKCSFKCEDGKLIMVQPEPEPVKAVTPKKTPTEDKMRHSKGSKAVNMKGQEAKENPAFAAIGDEDL